MSDVTGTVRTRFAPSPTGWLHVGTARTALFSYLHARRHGGAFVLRIEDTDVERNVERGAEAIAEALAWLGLRADEGYGVGGPNGPYVQTERLERYQASVASLVERGLAYPCWCTPEELAERRKAAQAAGRPPGYDGRCRDLPDSVVRAHQAEGRVPAIRFRLPDEGETVVTDLIRGTVVFDNATLTDFVILRPSGIPTYMFAAVYDDTAMGITDVIRGDDLLASTPSQLHVFRALGREVPPRFAHLPLLVGPDGRKLSKRHGAIAVEELRSQGILPEALVNYLALLGWALDDHTEHFTLADLEHAFDVERVSRNPAQFDTRKLEALNGWHLRQLTPEDFAARTLEFVRWSGLPDADPEFLRRAAPLVSERVTRLDQVPGMVGFLLVDEVEIDPAGAEKVLDAEGRAFLDAAAKLLPAVEPWTAEAIEATLRGLQAERGLKPKKAFQPVRLAITGTLVSPPLFESMALLGKARSLARLERARAYGG